MKKMLQKNLNYDKACQKRSIKKAKNIIDSIRQGITQNFIKYGNGKLPPSVARLDIPEVATCMANCHGCYAKKQLFDCVKDYRLSNLYNIYTALYDKFYQFCFLKNFKKLMQNHFNLYGKKACLRLHASGDIFSEDYFKLEGIL